MAVTERPQLDRREHRWLLVLSAVLFLALALAPRTATSGDTRYVLPVAVSIVHERDLDIDEYPAPEPALGYAVDDQGDHRFNYFPWTSSLLAVPAVLALDVLGAIGIGPGGGMLGDGSGAANQVAKLLASACVAAGAYVVMRLVHDRTRLRDRRRRLLLALGSGTVFALATPAASIASRSLWQHTPSILATSVALWCAGRLGRERPGWAWGLGVALFVGYAVRPTNALIAAALLAWVALRHRERLVPVVAGGAAAAVPWVAVNLLTWGRPLSPYHTRGGLGLHEKLGDAVAANLISPARGLLVFVPLAALAVAGTVIATRRSARAHTTNDVRPHRADVMGDDGLERWCAGIVVAYLIAVSLFADTWYAGHTYGPRFMTDTLPLLVVMAVPALDRLLELAPASATRRRATAALAVAVVWGLVVHLSPALIPAGACWNEHPVNIADDPSARVWDLSDPQVLVNMRAVVEHGPKGAITLTCEEYATRVR